MSYTSTLRSAKRPMNHYPDPTKQSFDELSAIVRKAAADAIATGALPEVALPDFTVEVPADRAHGDLSTNAAMVSARAFRLAPRKIAETLLAHLSLEGSSFRHAEIAGPGFLNFFLSEEWYAGVVNAVLSCGADYGKSDYGNGQKVMVEFVSANPTGPMHIGNARGGALGDCLAAVLDRAGYEVTREFYINDAGNQIEKFGCSLEARYLQKYLGEEAVPFPEDGYHGADIITRAEEFAAIEGDKYVNASPEERKKALVAYALPRNIEGLRTDLGRYRIEYDVWFSESTLHESGAVRAVVDKLSAAGLTYEKEGALFYKATAYGGEKDEVLIRANGHPTYFAADIAYHYNKFAVRGFDRVINVWGADHHGHVARLKGAMDAVGLDGSKLDIVLMQLVKLMRDGELVKVSKRTGKSITLADLLDEVPLDAARFFFNLREPNTQMDFDLGLAVEESSQNPVYYVQYAHARICHIIQRLAAEGVTFGDGAAIPAVLTDPAEHELIRHIAAFPSEIADSARLYDPSRITKYAITLATLYHKFYDRCRVLGEAPELTKARAELCVATKTVIANLLTMLKIDCPEQM
ncbi:MAG: arginine--tRNA ligase [Oscillospiraceae bacterium]|nr:arginine--tRNA ligase [Oscillospiraceae bacterium]